MVDLSSITKEKDFQKVFAHKKSFALKTFLIYYLRENFADRNNQDSREHTDYYSKAKSSHSVKVFSGFKISKQVSKKAVVRNLIKRRLKHILRILAQENFFDSNCTSYSIIFIARKNIQFLSFQKLLSDVKFALSKLSFKSKIMRNFPSSDKSE